MVVVWTGTEMLVWGNGNNADPLGKYGGIYNPTTNTWRQLDNIGAADQMSELTAVWTGGSPGRMLIWTGTLGRWYMLPLSLYQKP
jgi:hypothetical protein